MFIGLKEDRMCHMVCDTNSRVMTNNGYIKIFKSDIYFCLCYRVRTGLDGFKRVPSLLISSSLKSSSSDTAVAYYSGLDFEIQIPEATNAT